MNRRNFLEICALSLGALSTGSYFYCTEQSTSKPGLPNILFIYADDMGFGDVQAFNADSKIPTPNLNRLAEEGIKFTDAHTSSAVCSPSRYSALTGRYCWRTWLKNGVLWPPEDRPLIEKERLTIASMLKRQNYSTACFGKWHLGIEWGRDDKNNVDFNKPIQFGPNDVGFDEFYGIAGSLDMVPYVFYADQKPSESLTRLQEGLNFPKFIRPGPKGETFEPQKVLDRLTEKAVEYIKQRSKTDRPFFLYLPLTAPHKPTWPAERFVGKTNLGPYGDFVHQTDWTVGEVLNALDQNGLVDNTLVIFSSDNGSYMYRWQDDEADHTQDETVQGYHTKNHQANYIWRGTKADVWEAGHRIPFIVRWPGRVKANTECDETVCMTDLFATFAEITGFSIPPNAAEDSFSMLPLLMGKEREIPRDPVVHHSANGIFSLREGKWKMVFGNGSGGREKPLGKPFEKPYFLFDLESDPSETTNIISLHPQIAEQLSKKLEILMQNSGYQ